MTIRSLRADFFDASALVKIYSNEPCSDVVREYFLSRANEVHDAILFLRSDECTKR